jgi:hypothetical protein
MIEETEATSLILKVGTWCDWGLTAQSVKKVKTILMNALCNELDIMPYITYTRVDKRVPVEFNANLGNEFSAVWRNERIDMLPVETGIGSLAMYS